MYGILSLKEMNLFSEMLIAVSIIYVLLLSSVLRQNKNYLYKLTDPILYSSILFLVLCFVLELNLDYPSINSAGFNDSVILDYLSFSSKLLIGIAVIIYLLTIKEYLKKQRNGDLEYVVIILLAVLRTTVRK
jgi:NADH:ubiquinone oxidoreductase subunit 2 (subunit N)